jgi:hypothetical protein
VSQTAAEATCQIPALRDLCDQQFWLFGRDIGFHRGNLLLEAGFERRRFGSGRPTQYVFESTANSISLWGFGLHWICNERGRALFTGRDGDFLEAGTSELLAVRDPWTVGRRLRLGNGVDGLLASNVCSWLAEYEAWVLQAAGPDHRSAALEGWSPCCEPGRIASGWADHASLFAALATQATCPSESATPP